MRALITGITGQDGSYLAEWLAYCGDEVYGLVHGQPTPKRAWIQELVPTATLVEGDLLDQSSLISVLAQVQPDVVFNLGALTFVGMSWHQPVVMTETTGLGVLRILEAIRLVNNEIAFVQASSSEMFGSMPAPQNQLTRLHPRSPYGVAKAFAHQTTINYRESYGIPASTVTMFNHTSPRRGAEFVERKISLAAGRIAAGLQDRLALGNLHSSRDLGWAPEYMELMACVARDALDGNPNDFMVGTGTAVSIKQILEFAFRYHDLNWRDHVVDDPDLHRPADVEALRADPDAVIAGFGHLPTWTMQEILTELLKKDTLA